MNKSSSRSPLSRNDRIGGSYRPYFGLARTIQHVSSRPNARVRRRERAAARLAANQEPGS